MAPGHVVRARLFGTISVAVDGRVLTSRDFGGIKPKQLLEVLLLARGRPVSKDQLADALWADGLPRNVAATLENYVSVLRRRLAPDGGGRELLVTERGAYRFAGGSVQLDLDRFDTLVERAAHCPTPVAISLWADAVTLADRGELLDDEPYAEWAEPHRTRYRGRLLDVLLDAAEATLALAQLEKAREYAHRAIAIDRFAEGGYRIDALAAYALGRQHDALESYERLRTLLDAELGLEPMPETRELQLAILRQVDVSALLPRASAAVRPVAHAPSEVPLVGRAADLAGLEAALGDGLAGRFSLIVVEGEAGVGKTRLMTEALARLGGVRIGRATCCQLESRLPYVPLGTALREALTGIDLAGASPALRLLLPELAVGGRGDAVAQLEALEAVVALVRTHAPLVLVLDDLHWADEQTIAALAYLRRRCRDLPGAVIGGVRVEEAHPAHPLRRLIPDASLQLLPLTQADLAGEGLGELYAATGGLPEFLAAAMSGTEDLAAAVAAPVLARCRQEGPSAYSVLVGAAVLEPPFAPDTLAAALLMEPAELTLELERLTERRFLEPAGAGFRFRHDLVRRVLAARVSDARRKLLLVA